METDPVTILIYSLIAFFVGIGSLVSVRKLDRKNYIIQKVTPLPLALVNERDDVWLKGVAECDAPLSGPHFGYTCLYYDYELAELVTKLTTNSKGRSRIKVEWKIHETSSEATGFSLRDGEHTIHVDGSDAEFKDHASNVDRVGKWRHTLNYFPYPSDVNAIGSVSEGKERLEKHANIPLVVTTKNRKDFVKEAEKEEVWGRQIGFILFWVGMAGFFYGFFDWKSWPAPTHGQLAIGTLALAAVPATIIVALYWCAFKYNTLVAYRNRVENAWHQIDVDLSMRYELIPKLVECVKGIMEHERKLIVKLSALRNQAFTSREKKLHLEGKVATSVHQTIARIERYPNLKAQGTTFKLTRQIIAIEEKIAHGRLFYNETVREYNDNIQMFPQVLIAQSFGFVEHTFFSIPGEKARMPDIEISDAE